MRYILKHKNIPVLIFDLSENEVIGAVINKLSLEHLPLPLKLIVNADNIEEENGELITVDEEGCCKIEMWLSERAVPVSRYNYEKYIQNGKTGIIWLLENNAFSFDDCYIITEIENDVSWETVKERMNSLDELVTVEHNSNEMNFIYKGHNSALGGQLEKYWFRQDGELSLCKKHPQQAEILSIREIIASEIYKKQGFPACEYHFLRDSDKRITGCTCKSFVDNDSFELITAYDLLQEYGLTQDDNVYELLVKLATLKGADGKAVSDFLDMMTLVDYLITNRDRHEGNIGFLRNADTLEIVGPAPVYDSGSSLKLEGNMPENDAGTTVNGLYPTEDECLKHVQNRRILNPELLPEANEIKRILDESTSLSAERKEGLLSLFIRKAEYIRKLADEHSYTVDGKKVEAENAMNMFRVIYKGLLKKKVENEEHHKFLVMIYNGNRLVLDFVNGLIFYEVEGRRLLFNEIKDKNFKQLVVDAQKQLKEFLKEYDFDIKWKSI